MTKLLRSGLRASAAVASLSLLALLAAPAAAQDKDNPLDAAEVTRRVQDFYKTTADYQARFEQIYTDVAAGDSRTSTGRVFFKKPGKMRWDYLAEKGGKTQLAKVLVSDGSVFTVYEPEFDQYFKKCLKESQLPTALSFLMGEGELLKDFEPKLLKSTKEGTHRLELSPRASQGTYKKLEFVVDAATFAVQEAIIYDPYGNTNRLVFHKPLVNKNLPDQGFKFAPPKSARVVGGPAEVTCK